MTDRIGWPLSQFVGSPMKGDHVTTRIDGTVHQIRHVGTTLFTFMCATPLPDHRDEFWVTDKPVNCIDCLARTP